MRYYTLLFIIILLAVSIVFSEIVSAVTKPNDGPGWTEEDWDEEHPTTNNWHHEFIKLPSAWDFTTGSKDVKIGVVDTGFDIMHKDLKENIVPTLFLGFPRDHGTHVAGIIGAKGNNGKGIAGTMWDVSLLPYDASIPFTDAIFPAVAIKDMWLAIKRGVRIINYSSGKDHKYLWSAKLWNRAWRHCLLDAIKEDVLFVFAAGQKDAGVDDKYSSPSSLSKEYDNVISVTASDMMGNLYTANYGDISVAAPGARIYSTLPGDNYGVDGGTSMAAPFVSGLAGLIFSKAKEMGKTLTAAQVKDLIVRGAIEGNKSVSGPDDHPIPIINAYKSLKLLAPPVGVVIPFADITLDGNPGDWSSIPTVCVDAESDDNTDYTGADIKSFKFAQDEDFIYVMADFYDGVPNEVLGQVEPFAYQFHFTSLGPTGLPEPIHIDNLGVFYDTAKWDIAYLSSTDEVTGSLIGSSVAVDSVIELKIPKNKLPDTFASCLQIGTDYGIDGVLGDITEWRILSL